MQWLESEGHVLYTTLQSNDVELKSDFKTKLEWPIQILYSIRKFQFQFFKIPITVNWHDFGVKILT